MPIEDSAPEELIEQHKAVVMAESTTRASRGAKARKKSHSELDLARQHSVEQEFAALHHTSMVSSTYSTVSLRDIDPIATMHTGDYRHSCAFVLFFYKKLVYKTHEAEIRQTLRNIQQTLAT